MTLRLLASVEGHEERVWHVCWSPDGSRFVSCGEDRTIRIWSVEERAFSSSPAIICTQVIEEQHTRTIRCVEWSPCSRYIASASFDGTVLVFQSIGGSFQRIAALEGHENEVKCVAWSGDGSLLATCGRDKKVWVWEQVDRTDFEVAAVLDGHSQDVKFITFHPHRSVLYSCSYDDSIKVWAEDGGDWYCAKTLVGHSSTVWGLSLIRDDGQQLVSCGDDRALILWECDGSDVSGDWRRVCLRGQAAERAIYSISTSSPSSGTNLIATGAGDDSISLWTVGRADDGQDLLQAASRRDKAHSGDVNCVRWRPQGNAGNWNGQQAPLMLLSCGDDGLVRLWTAEP